MSSLLHPFDLTEEHVNQMRTEGALVLRQLFTPTALSALDEAASNLTVPPDQERRRRFRRLAYGDGAPAAIVQTLCQTSNFSSLLGRLIGKEQVITNLVSFELAPGMNGEPWHFGRRSFCFIGPEVPAYTLWIPLTNIREREEGGGLAWVPENVFSAYSRVQQWSFLFRMLGEGEPDLALARALAKQFGTDGDPWVGPFDLLVLEARKLEQDFAPGDALIFSRNVWHRTSPLLSPTLANRKAVVMRFVDGRAKLDKKIISGFSRTLRPKVDNFLSFLLDSDDSLPIGEQEFSLHF
ncbi:hypothetical protein [Burkholderia glumae]|uniref:Phytanoyl-CoA dioxygenase n=1 Tax=Burkholderia glumae TaxID=337 RepID=A0AAP9Y4U4_BURGL|nr:hypothetical protein [Burkholderia glumae]ACR29041.1 Hypothetical protein bglu_1g19280 [Burkholderia glumae BGR1]AJY65102.1 hypothetical protein KS03_2776 [Burkholderia glumae LMG 2196 = ATCC 33617]MCM2483121.1 hypothetical protein [Burkholderia glumae]MCM2506437.1 hypothetical protein [Burkholderia glumae]MCM2538108.1 hypothetical protein [Burkholderia glumae]